MQQTCRHSEYGTFLQLSLISCFGNLQGMHMACVGVNQAQQSHPESTHPKHSIIILSHPFWIYACRQMLLSSLQTA